MRGVILMTALVPTIGHEYLILFASKFMAARRGHLDVIISTRSSEPTSFKDRVCGLGHLDADFQEHADDNAPQNPPDGDQTEFWEYWKNVAGDKADYVFASEPYGEHLAEVLGAEFIPVDINREVVPAKGTEVRRNLFDNQEKITREFRNYIHQQIVIFGPESCGKTTLAKKLANELNGRFVHEWARPYLETVGPEITEQKLFNIVVGQHAAEEAARLADHNLVTVFDTDIFTTFGFYVLNHIKIPKLLEDLTVDRCRTGRSRFYIVMPDTIPFEPDPLRYGGDKRESDVSFWTDLLNSYHQPFYTIKATDPQEQLLEAVAAISKQCPLGQNFTYDQLRAFVRD